MFRGEGSREYPCPQHIRKPEIKNPLSGGGGRGDREYLTGMGGLNKRLTTAKTKLYLYTGDLKPGNRSNYQIQKSPFETMCFDLSASHLFVFQIHFINWPKTHFF